MSGLQNRTSCTPHTTWSKSATTLGNALEGGDKGPAIRLENKYRRSNCCALWKRVRHYPVQMNTQAHDTGMSTMVLLAVKNC